MTKRRRIAQLIATSLATVVIAGTLAACGDDEPAASDAALPAITVGSANFPENVLLAEIYAGALTAKGATVTKKLNVGSREALFPAMEQGDIHLLPEYTGALLSFVSKGAAKERDTAGQVTALTAQLPAELVVLEPSPAEDKDTVTCNKETVDKFSLTSIEDLAAVDDQIIMGGPPELRNRQGFGLPGLKSVYGIEFKEFKALDVAGPLTVAALKDNKVNCANLFSTQSAIAVNGFISLDDPKGVVEGENVIPFISKEKATPEVTATLNAVSAALDTETLKDLVKRVEVDKEAPDAVAAAWLTEKGLDTQ
jgi:osmoprotectant transport system substrate-binding protein